MPSTTPTAKDLVEAWKARQLLWGALFNEARTTSGRSLESIANELGIGTDRVKNWQHGRQRLDPAFLEPLAQAVGASTLDWALALGFLPRHLTPGGKVAEEVRRQLVEANRRLQAMQDSGAATGQVVGAALASGRWSVEAEPVLEGPAVCQIRTFDLVRISRSDGTPTSATDIRADEAIADALNAARARRPLSNVWSDGSLGSSREPSEARSKWPWLVPRLNIPRVALRDPLRPAVESIAVVAPRPTLWPGDVAAIVAMCLGLGSTSAAVEARSARGEQLIEHRPPTGVDEAHAYRGRLAIQMLQDPFGALRDTVWSYSAQHQAPDVVKTLAEYQGPDLLVYLRPTDEFLAFTPGTSSRFSPDHWRRIRDEFDSAFEGASGNRLIYNVGRPTDVDSPEVETREIRDIYYERAILIALRLIRDLHLHLGGPSLDRLHPSTPESLAALARTIDPTVLEDESSSFYASRRFV